MLSRRTCLFALGLARGAAMLLPALSAAAVPGTQAWRESGAQRLGAMAARPMSFTLVLAPRHGAALNSFVAKPHAALRPAQFAARYGPSAKTLATIRSWATAHQLKVSSVSANRLLVRLTGSSTRVAKALGTHFAIFSSPQSGRFSRSPARPSCRLRSRRVWPGCLASRAWPASRSPIPGRKASPGPVTFSRRCRASWLRTAVRCRVCRRCQPL
jgi:Pro-kumamolisin, activation domain